MITKRAMDGFCIFEKVVQEIESSVQKFATEFCREAGDWTFLSFFFFLEKEILKGGRLQCFSLR
jgi:hypothetical protein